MTPSATRTSSQFDPSRTAPADVATAFRSPAYSELVWRTASTGVGAVKWAAAAGLLAGAAGLGSTAVAACAASAAAVGGCIWAVEMANLRYGVQFPHVTLQHALCNEMHTLAGGLLGATPVVAGLVALAAGRARPDGAGNPAMDYNGLAMLTAMVAAPTAVLLGAGARAASDEAASGFQKMKVYGLPLLATGVVLVAPAVALQAGVSPEAASRFVITFGGSMACAAVRELLTQATALAWGGIERDGVGAGYGLSQARGAERTASTVAPTAASCLLFAATTGLLLHQLDADFGLGMAPAGQSVLAMTAGEAARRTALRYTLMQSTNELLEGIARCLPLAAYARLRGIPLRYRDDGGAGAVEVPAQLRRRLADPETLRRAALFASVRTMDGTPSNLLSQLAATMSPGVFWNGYRVAAVLLQGATMARSPIIAAWLLPGTEVNTDCETDVAVIVPWGTDESASAASTATSGPLSDPAVQWA